MSLAGNTGIVSVSVVAAGASQVSTHRPLTVHLYISVCKNDKPSGPQYALNPHTKRSKSDPGHNPDVLSKNRDFITIKLFTVL